MEIYELVMCALLVFVFLLPGMISMYQSSGTLLYPILGKGYHGSVYGSFSVTSGVVTLLGIIKVIISSASASYFGAFMILLVIRIRTLFKNIPPRAAMSSFMISSGLGTLILALATGGYGYVIYRYSFFVLHTAVIILIPTAYDTGVNKSKMLRMGTSLAVIMIAIACVLAQTFKYSYKNHLRFLDDNIKAGLSNTQLFSDKERQQYLTMQQSIPESETILTRVEKPFLLNFERNSILIADCPGEASPPPGMPFLKGPEALADYLILQSIRYVAYSYANEANFRWKNFGNRLRHRSLWVRSEAEHTFDFQDNLKQLGETRERIYDDGDIFVLDLLNHTGQE